MTNRQFNFSFLVGIALAVLGGVILGHATVGFSLIALGAAISILALLTRGARSKTGQAQPAPVRHFQDSAADY